MSGRHRLVLNFTNKLELKRHRQQIFFMIKSQKNVKYQKIYSWKNVRRKSYNNNKFKIPDVT